MRLAGRFPEVKGGEVSPPRRPYPRLAEASPRDVESPPGRSLSSLHRPLRLLQRRRGLPEKPERDLLGRGGILEEEERGERLLILVLGLEHGDYIRCQLLQLSGGT